MGEFFPEAQWQRCIVVAGQHGEPQHLLERRFQQGPATKGRVRSANSIFILAG